MQHFVFCNQKDLLFGFVSKRRLILNVDGFNSLRKQSDGKKQVASHEVKTYTHQLELSKKQKHFQKDFFKNVFENEVRVEDVRHDV